MGKIVLEGIWKSFASPNSQTEKRIQALKDVSLSINKDEFISIIGPSGCGKTTLLRIIDGLIPPDKGQVRIDGKAVMDPGYNRAMVFQNFGLLPWKTVLENVAFGLKLRGVSKTERFSRARQYLELVGLKGFEYYYPRQLSGGMQQRVGMSRALCSDPDILLMDEPLGSVDAQTREVMQEEILRIWDKAKKTVVFITHSIDEAIYLSDRVVIMDPRPGRVSEILEVDLPRPRWKYDVRGEPKFVELRRYAWEHLRSQIRSAGPIS